MSPIKESSAIRFNCEHKTRVSGDNYGEWCDDCGQQLKKYDPASLEPDRNVLE